MRNIFIGDIHGCYDEFQELINKLQIQDSDRVYIAGDMVNRGPKSFEILEFLYLNRNQFQAIKGNHEVGLLKHLDGLAPEYENKQYILLRKQLSANPDIWEYVKNLPLYIETDLFLLVHAGVLPGIEISKQTEETLTELYYYKNYPWFLHYPASSKKIIYGHWSENGLQIRSNTIGLDSGCCIGNKLSAYILETGEVVQVDAHK